MLDFQNISIQRKGKKVLDDFSLKAPDGVILALLGEDKEGKSTLLKAASGGEKPETGDIYIDGISIYEKGGNAYCNFGYMSKEYGFYSLLKVEEYYELFLALYKVGGRYRSRRIEEVLELLDMKEYEGAFIGELPAETLPFLYLGKAILQEPEWLLMDEPTNGLDIPSKATFRQVVAKNLSDDTTLIISTHQVHDVEQLIDHVVILDQSRLLCDASVGEITQRYSFETRPANEMTNEVLYAEPSLQGNNVIVPHAANEPETQLNLEMFFSAVTLDKIQM